MGERTPHLDSTARGGWIGLTARHTRADLIRSLIEGVSYSQRDCLDIIESLGVPIQSVRVSGGGFRSPFWRRLLANILGKPIVTLETQEGSAYGAALLALVGTGESASVPEESAAPRSAKWKGSSLNAIRPRPMASGTRFTDRFTPRCGRFYQSVARQ